MIKHRILLLAAAAAASYLIGCISPSYILGRRKGLDIRNHGTCNAGATNAAKTLGMSSGVIVLIIDIGKTIVCITAARALFSGSMAAGVIAGLSCMLGHIFPVFMKFRGGRGSACLAGIVLTLTPELFIPMVLGLILIGLATDYASLLPLTAAGIYPLLFFWRTDMLTETLMLAIIFPLMLWTHRGNFEKHNSGEESSFRSFVFKHKFEDSK